MSFSSSVTIVFLNSQIHTAVTFHSSRRRTIISSCFSASLLSRPAPSPFKNCDQINRHNYTADPHMTRPVFWRYVRPIRHNENTVIWQMGTSRHIVDRCIVDIEIPRQQTSYTTVEIKLEKRGNAKKNKRQKARCEAAEEYKLLCFSLLGMRKSKRNSTGTERYNWFRSCEH